MNITSYKVLLFHLLICIGVTGYGQIQLKLCESVIIDWRAKKLQLDKDAYLFEDGKLLTKNDLKRVIYPEYVSFENNMSVLEVSLIKMFYKVDAEKFKRISFGPFQMQLQFIKMVLDDATDESIQDPILVKCKKMGYSFCIANISLLKELKTQWKLLLLYEQFCIKRNILRDKLNMDAMINFYNSGRVENNNIIFTKIKCERKTYLFWSEFIKDL